MGWFPVGYETRLGCGRKLLFGLGTDCWQRSAEGVQEQRRKALRAGNKKRSDREIAPFGEKGWMSLVETALATVAAIAVAATEAAATTAAAEAATLAATATKATTLAAAEAATLATTEATASGAVFLRAGLVDRQLTATDLDTIGLLSGHLGLLSGAHGHERETTRTTGHAVKGDVNVGDSAELLEMSAQLLSGSLEGQIADVEFGTLH